MNFGLSQEISEDIYEKAHIITDISKKLEEYFKNRNYGNGITFIAIGVISVHPQFDFFCKIRKKYSKTKKILEYDVKLDHEKLKNADKKMILEMLHQHILESFSIFEEKKIPDFDKDSFIKDIEQCFTEMRGQ